MSWQLTEINTFEKQKYKINIIKKNIYIYNDKGTYQITQIKMKSDNIK